MRHGKALRKLGRTTSHRMAMLRNLSESLFEKERIRTTLPKAKELRPFAEKLITMAKRDDLHSRRLVARSIQNRAVVKKLFDALGPRFAQRPGGYSRILKLGWRKGDGAEMAILELIGSEPTFVKEGKEGKKKKKKAKTETKPKDSKAAASEGPESSADEESESKGKARKQGASKSEGRARSGSAKSKTKGTKTTKK